MDLGATATAVAEESGIRLAHDRLAVAMDALAEEPLEREGEAPSGANLVARLIDALTIKESYFLRQPEQLRTLPWGDLLANAMAGGRGSVRVWSAACANGEEPYTLALLASEFFGGPCPPVDVLGTDIAASALERAAAGTYGPRAVRHLSPQARDRFFEPADDGASAVGEQLRALVRFKRHNLARDATPPPGERPFDLVVCRNVLIYFEPFAIDHFVGGLQRALVPGGKVVLGAADRLCLTQRSLRGLGGVLAGAPPLRRLPERPARPPARRPPAAIDDRRPPRHVTDPAIAGALRLADEGKLDEALKVAAPVVEQDPMNAPAQFVLGTLELTRGDAPAAVRALRAALYADSGFAVAAFQMGRAHDLRGEESAARRAYRLALECLDAGPSPYPWLLEDLDAADIAVACAARLNRG